MRPRQLWRRACGTYVKVNGEGKICWQHVRMSCQLKMLQVWPWARVRQHLCSEFFYVLFMPYLFYSWCLFFRLWLIFGWYVSLFVIVHHVHPPTMGWQGDGQVTKPTEVGNVAYMAGTLEERKRARRGMNWHGLHILAENKILMSIISIINLININYDHTISYIYIYIIYFIDF